MDCLDIIIIAEVSFILVCNIELVINCHTDELKADLLEHNKFVRTLGTIFYALAFFLNYCGVGKRVKKISKKQSRDDTFE